MTDERCKQIMDQLGMPESRSLMQAIYQVANETAQEVRKKLTSDNSDYAPCIICRGCQHTCKTEGNVASCDDYLPKHGAYCAQCFSQRKKLIANVVTVFEEVKEALEAQEPVKAEQEKHDTFVWNG